MDLTTGNTKTNNGEGGGWAINEGLVVAPGWGIDGVDFVVAHVLYIGAITGNVVPYVGMCAE